MLKKIKTTKYLNLHELIKYVWENSVNEKRVFLGNHGQRVVFDNVGGFYPSGYAYSPDTTFKVEIEEEFTEDTEFELLVGVYFYDDIGRYNASTFYNRSIDDMKDSEALCIYALINGRLELIWERED